MEPGIIQGRTLISVLPQRLQTTIRETQSLEEDEEYCRIRLELENRTIRCLKPTGVQTCKSKTGEPLILPLLFNAHTHLGDSFITKHHAREELPRDIVSLVAPPDGLKHRLLREAKDEEIIQGITLALLRAQAHGVTGLMDFREHSLKGLELFVGAYFRFSQQTMADASVVRPLRSRVLGRPEAERFNCEEVEQLLRRSAGINISSITDLEPGYVQDIRDAVTIFNRRHPPGLGGLRKLFAFHASERVREDVDTIIGLGPDFVVHCARATESDLARMAEAGIPIVVCPSSNLFFGVPLDIGKMLRNGVSLALGTDNGMLHPPTILAEMKCMLENFRVTHGQALEMGLLFRDLYLRPLGAAATQDLEEIRETRRAKGYLYEGSREGFMVVEGAGALDEFDPGRCRVRVF